MFSQNDEDGAIEDVFKHIGTTNKVNYYPKNCVGILSCLCRFMLNLAWRTAFNATHAI